MPELRSNLLAYDLLHGMLEAHKFGPVNHWSDNVFGTSNAFVELPSQ